MAGDSGAWVGTLRLELHVPEARSLKEKRSEVRGLAERLKRRHRVLVVETGHHDLHQRASLVVCALSTAPSELEDRLDRIERTVEETFGGVVSSRASELIEV